MEIALSDFSGTFGNTVTGGGGNLELERWAPRSEAAIVCEKCLWGQPISGASVPSVRGLREC